MLVGIDASRAAISGRTGTETYSLYLIREVLRQGTGHRFRLYFREADQAALFPRDAARWEARTIPFPRLWTHARLSWEMLTRQPQALWVPAHVLPLVRPACTLASVHDLGYLYVPEAHRPFDRWYLHWSTRFNCRAASRVLALSAATRDDLMRAYGVLAERVTVVYPGVRPGMGREPEGAVAEARRRYGLDGPYFLYVGTLQPRKNLLRLLQAFAQARGAGAASGALLVLAGKDGGLLPALQAEAQRMGLGQAVRFPTSSKPSPTASRATWTTPTCRPSTAGRWLSSSPPFTKDSGCPLWKP